MTISDFEIARADLVQRWRNREWIDVEPAAVLHRLLGDVNECEHDIHGDPTACYRDVMAAFLDDLVTRGWTPPNESHGVAEIDSQEAIGRVVAELASQRQRNGLSQRDVARRMGTQQSAVCELETLRVEPQLSTLARYAAACGSRVVIGVVEPIAERPGQ